MPPGLTGSSTTSNPPAVTFPHPFFATMEAVVFPRQEQRHLPWINLRFVCNTSPLVNVFEDTFDFFLSNSKPIMLKTLDAFNETSQALFLLRL